MFDADGYPTDTFLDSIKAFDIKSYADCVKLFEIIKPFWKYADVGYWTESNGRLEDSNKPGMTYAISTGGWSGNESIISALESNRVFYALCWYSSRRGGHYVFEVRL